MARRLEPFDRGAPIEIRLEDRAIRAFSQESVAAALIASGEPTLARSLKYHRPRGAFCLDGNCSGCLMRIDGVPNIRSCLTRCRDQMRVQTQNAYPSADLDVLGAVDWLFRGGMDHHTLMTGSRVLNAVTNRVVRQLSGLGRIPDQAPTSVPEVAERDVDIVVVGGGPAGLAAASAAAREGAAVLLLDQQPALGGSLRVDPRFGPAAADELALEARSAGVVAMTSTAALAFYPEDGNVLVAATPTELVRVTATRTIHAGGGYSQNLLFSNNDRPGVMAARAVGRLLCEHGIGGGHSIVVVGSGAYPEGLRTALQAAGVDANGVAAADVAAVRGRKTVRAIETTDGQTIPCDVVAVWRTPSPATELARQHGCDVSLTARGGGFALDANEDGRTSIERVYAAGDVCGYVGPERAAANGARVGRAAALDWRKGSH